MTDSAHPHFPRRRSPPPPTLIQNTMGLIRRHSVIAFIGILVTVMLLVTQLKALPGQQIVMRADQMSCEDARKLDLTKMTMAEFKPEMVVGLYFVQDENDVMFAKLSGEKKPFITAKQLPPKHRVIPEGSFVTMDWVEDRFNVHIRNDTHQIYKAKFG